jgi:hypothetical protein
MSVTAGLSQVLALAPTVPPLTAAAALVEAAAAIATTLVTLRQTVVVAVDVLQASDLVVGSHPLPASKLS